MLYQIYSECPGLVAVSEGHRYNQDSTEVFDETFTAADPSFWGGRELSETLERIAAATNLDYKLRLFIDGLYEYEGDHSQLAILMRNLSRNTNIEVCVSSRPWNVFNNAFGSTKSTLRLEELTRSDIKLFVCDELEEELETDEAALELVDEIVEKARGVFLWVALVVRSLRERDGEVDNLDTMRRRVAEFPNDIEEFFRHILKRVNKVYKVRTAQALKLAMRVLHSQIYKNHSFIGFWLLAQDKMADPRFAFKMEENFALNITDLQKMAVETRRFLNACCKDFLHMPTIAFKDSAWDRVSLFKHQIEFLHRTVYDFLDSGDMLELLNENLPSY